jgi:glycosyltransferase involved in cell wall biosynthesis
MVIAQVLDKFLPITEPWIYSQIKGLEKSGVKSEIFCHRIINKDSYRHTPIYSYKDLPNWKINLHRLRGKLTNEDGATLFWKDLIKRKKIDLIHSHFGWAAQKGIDLAIQNNISHAVTFYGADVFRDPFDPEKIEYQKKLPLIFKKSKLILCVSNLLKRKLIDLGATERKIKVWRPGVKVNIDISKYKKRRNNKFKIISIGRFIKWKGQEYLIKALSEVTKKYPNIEATFIGAGSALEECKKLSKKLRVDSKTKFLGKLPDYSDVIREIACSDVIVHSSFIASDGTRDSLGVVLAEAAMCGVPAIASNSGGIPEVVIDGQTGFLVEEKNSSEIAKRIINLTENRKLLQKLAKNAEKKANEMFDMENQIKKLNRIISNEILT